VIGFPVLSGADQEALAQVLDSVASIQRGFTLKLGLFVRGGVAMGPIYIDDTIVYGTGLLDAYDKEKVANFPRILLHASAAEQAVASSRRTTFRSPLGGLAIRDEYGELFVNYLDETWAAEDESPTYCWLERHCELVSKNLERFKGNAHVLEKYAWVARYHNYICGLIPDADSYRLADHAPLAAFAIR
jgi:hypothetical protein